jgi:hypothetical protein
MSARHHHENVMEAISPVLSIFYWPGLLLSLFFCGYWIWHLPSAGIAVGALGAVGVFVALKGEKIREGHRVIWALITVVFLFTEVRAIKDQEEKHAQTMKQIVDSYKEAKTTSILHLKNSIPTLLGWRHYQDRRRPLLSCPTKTCFKSRAQKGNAIFLPYWMKTVRACR